MLNRIMMGIIFLFSASSQCFSACEVLGYYTGFDRIGLFFVEALVNHSYKCGLACEEDEGDVAEENY